MEKQITNEQQNLPQAKFNKHVKPYWRYNRDVLNDAVKEKNKSYEKWCKAGRPRGNCQIYLEYKNNKRVFRQQQRMTQMQYEIEMINELESEEDINANFLWYLFRKARNNNNQGGSVNPIRNEEGILVTEPELVLNEWALYYESLFRKQPGDSRYAAFHHDIDAQVENMTNEMQMTSNDLFITESEIKRLFNDLKNGKASGYDNIESEHIKFGGKLLVTVVTKLFNRCLQHGFFPQVFKYGLLVPIPKGGKKDLTDMGSYRGITLLTTLGKIFEKAVKQKIEEDFRIKCIEIPCYIQGAGKRHISSLHTNFLVRETINVANNQNKLVHLACLDIEKAFDKVWQNGLLYKMLQTGLHLVLLNILRESFKNFKLSVQIGRYNSRKFDVQQGVHQGGPLSGMLFQIFFDEILMDLQCCNFGVQICNETIACPTFADDIAILSETRDGLQQMVNMAYDYSCKWKFKFNPKKCITMTFGKYGDRKKIKMGNDSLEQVECTNYLGTPLYSNIKYEKLEIEKRIEKAYQNVWLIKAIGTARVNVNPLTFSKAYWACVITKLCYGLFMLNLSKSNLQKLDDFHANVAKNVQGLNANTPSVAALAGLKWPRISSHIRKELLLFIGHTIKYGYIHKNIILNVYLDQKKRKSNNTSIVYNFIEYGLKLNVLDIFEKYLNEGCFEISEWKKRVKEQANSKENAEWYATIIMYKSMETFTMVGIDFGSGFSCWKITRKKPMLLYKVKVMLKALITNNIKCGFLCKCEDVNIGSLQHIIFKCRNIQNCRGLKWNNVIREMPYAMRIEFENMNDNQKLRFMYTCCCGGGVEEWMDIIVQMIEFIYSMIKSYYESI